MTRGHDIEDVAGCDREGAPSPPDMPRLAQSVDGANPAATAAAASLATTRLRAPSQNYARRTQRDCTSPCAVHATGSRCLTRSHRGLHA